MDDPGTNGASFVLRSLGRCLEVNEPQLQADGARVQLGRCEGRPHQAWRHEGGQLIVRVDERCLEALGVEHIRPVPTVQTWACNGERAQRWRVAALPARVAPVPPPAAPPPLAPPTVRTVEAGPLFSNADADRKRPALCKPGRWNGQWVTTVAGRRSVCSCLSDAPASPPPLPAPGGTPALQAMSPDHFDELVRLLDNEAYPGNVLRTLQTVARDHRFLVEQVQRLFQLFAFGSDRLRAMDILLPRLTDRANAFQLLGEFTFESERDEARKLLERSPR